MAERLIQLGDYAEAGRWAALAENGYPRPAVLHVRIGTQLLQAHEPRLALEQFERAAALEPDEAEVQYRLGQALLETGRAADAVPHLRTAVARNPAMPLAGYSLARALASTGDRSGALEALTKTQPAAESRAQNFVAFGQLAMQLHDAAIAEAWFRRAVADTPSLAAAHQQLGLALGIQHRLPEAATELSEAVRLNPADATAHLNLAVVHAQRGDFQEARSEAEEALRLSPSYVQARQLLAALPSTRH
jgi:Flp pilus assembly protein TadD